MLHPWDKGDLVADFPVVEFTRFISDHVCNIFDFAKLVFYRDKSRFHLRNIYGLSLR